MKSIFVSSTFKDMQYERDLIQLEVLPELRERIAQYGENFNMVDLRWGIDTTELESDDGSKKILSVCLDQIDSCKPYILVFLGERYGWIPDEDIVKDNFYEENYDLVLDKSITELEIQYGALARKNPRVLFYFRNPIDTKNLSKDLKDIYSVESEIHKEKLKHLKEEITQRFPNNIRTYDLNWNPFSQSFEGLNELKEQIVEDVTQLIEEDLGPIKELSWEEKEIQEAWRAIEEKTFQFSARRDLLHSLLKIIKEDQQNLFLHGDSGIGKSTLLSKFASELSKDNTVIPILIGLTETSRSATNIVKMQIHELNRVLNINTSKVEDQKLNLIFSENSLKDETADKRETLNSLKEDLMNLLNQYSKSVNKPLILIYDGIDQFSEYEKKDFFSLLPDNLPPNVYMIFSSTSYEDIPLELSMTKNLRKEKVELLTGKEILEIINSTLKTENKELDKEIIQKILSKPEVSNPLYLSILLNRLFILDKDDFKIIKNMGDDMQAINEYLINIIKEAPNSLESIILYFFNEVAHRINFDQTIFLLKFLALSRNGLREQDLRGIYEESNDFWNTLDFARLQKYIRNYLIIKNDGYIDFSHRIFRESLNLHINEDERNSINQQLFNWIKSLSNTDLFKASEMYYYSKLFDDKVAFLDYLLPLAEEEFNYSIELSENEFIKVLNGDSDFLTSQSIYNILNTVGLEIYRNDKENSWFSSLIENYDLIKILPLYEFTIKFLSSFYTNTLSDLRNFRELFENFVQKLINSDTDLNLALWYLATFSKFLVEAKLNLRDYEEALWDINRAIDIFELFVDDEETLGRVINLSESYQKRGEIYRNLGYFDLAEQNFKITLELAKSLSQSNNDSYLNYNYATELVNYSKDQILIGNLQEAKNSLTLAIDLIEKELLKGSKINLLFLLSACFINIGEIERLKGNFIEAEEYFIKAYNIAQKVHNEVNNNSSLDRLVLTYDKLASLYLSTGDLDTAYQNFQRELTIIKEFRNSFQNVDIDLRLADIYFQLATIFLTNNESEKSLYYCEKAELILRKTYENFKDFNILFSLIKMLTLSASAHIENGDLETAISYYEQAYKYGTELIEVYPTADSKYLTATTLIDYGDLILNYNNDIEGLEILLTASDLLEEILKEEKRPLAQAMLSLNYIKIGTYYISNDNYSLATKFFNDANNILSHISSDSLDPFVLSNIANSYFSLGWLEETLENFSKSLEYFENAHTFFQKAYTRTPNDRYYLDLVVSEISILIQKYVLNISGIDYIKEFRNYYEIFKKYYTRYPNDFNIGNRFQNICNLLAGILREHSNSSQSINFYKEAIRINESLLNSFDLYEVRENLAENQSELASLYEELENGKESVNYFSQALEFYIQVYEQNSSNNILEKLISITSSLANIYMFILEEDKVALSYYNQVLNYFNQLDSNELNLDLIINLIHIYYRAALIYESNDDFNEALNHYFLALDNLDNYRNQINKDILRELENDITERIAYILSVFSRFEEAENYAKISLEGKKILFDQIYDVESLYNYCLGLLQYSNILRNLNRKSESKNLLNKALTLINQNSEVLELKEFVDLKNDITNILNTL